MPTPLAHENHVQPRPGEADAMRTLKESIEAINEERGTALLIGPGGTEIELPGSVFEALRWVVDGMSQGLTMTLIPHGAELTTQQAADMLHVSRPHLVKLLEQGEIAFDRVGTHRRVRFEDLLAYREKRAAARRDRLRELTRLAEESEAGYF